MAETTGERRERVRDEQALRRDTKARAATKTEKGFVKLTNRMIPPARRDAVELILTEREVQQHLWSAAHDRAQAPIEWAALLAKYVGRLAENAKERRLPVYRRNLVVIAAVCLSALEVEDEPQR